MTTDYSYLRENKNCITTRDIDRLKKTIKVGDEIPVDSMKSVYRASSDSYGRNVASQVTGTVIGLYRNFVVVRLPSGQEESIQYTDLLMTRKKSDAKAG